MAWTLSGAHGHSPQPASNKKEGFACYNFGSPSVNSFSYKPSYSSEEKDTVEAQNLRGVIWKAYPIKIQGTKKYK